MKILILTFYYAPDLSAGSFRTTALVKELRQISNETCEIDIITTQPNRYGSFSTTAPDLETEPGLSIHRIKLPNHKNGFFDQSRAFLTFAMEALKITKAKKYDLVFATSSRLMTGFLGSIIAARLKTPLYLDIRDIFFDTIKDILPKKQFKILSPIIKGIERYTFRNPIKVNLVSGGFLKYFQPQYPNLIYSIFTNGIDDIFVKNAPISFTPITNTPIKVLYAGNIGEGQGLHLIIPQLATKLAGKVDFLIIGDGGRKAKLIDALQAANCKNVELRSPISRNELLAEYKSADVLFLHLNDYEAFQKVLPSKIFEYGALGKPIWAGISGFANEFANENITNIATFMPCNADDACMVFDSLDLATQPRPQFIQLFCRQEIMKKMAIEIISCCTN